MSAHLYFLVFYLHEILLCISDSSGTSYGPQTDLRLMEINLPQPPQYYDYRHAPMVPRYKITFKCLEKIPSSAFFCVLFAIRNSKLIHFFHPPTFSTYTAKSQVNVEDASLFAIKIPSFFLQVISMQTTVWLSFGLITHPEIITVLFHDLLSDI